MATDERTEPARASTLGLDLEILRVPIGVVHPNSWNPNKQTDRTYTAERESIRTFGFIDPCLVWPHPDREGEWQIIDGEHRWRAAGDEHLTEILVTPLTNLTEAAAKKLTIVLNETRGDADVVLLGALLNDLQAQLGEEEFPLALPYSEGELAHLLALGTEDWDRFTQTTDEAGDEPAPPAESFEVVLVFTPAQHEAFQGKVEELRKASGLSSVPDTVLAAVTTAAAQLANKAGAEPG